MRVMAEEIELKLSLPEAARRALLRHFLLRQAQKLGTRRLVNVYFDTPDLALHRHGIALRTRRQGRRWLQTVKRAGNGVAGLSLRPEWEQPFDGRFDFGAIDDEITRALLERHRIRAHLAPVFETVFSRATWRLAPAPETSVLLMLDRGLIEADGAGEEISEIELELERGSPAVLFDIALALAADLPLQPAVLSKAERGFRLHRGTRPGPLKAAASPVLSGQTPQEAFRAVAADCILQLQMNELGAAGDDPEFIHQMRVALRRLRSALRVFRPALPGGFVAAAVPQIRALARVLGRARDLDVLALDVLAPARAAFPEDARIAGLCAAVEEERRRARAEARAALAAPAHAYFLLSFAAGLHAPLAAAANEPLADFAARRLGRLHKKLHALAEQAQGLEAGPLHALRVGAKRLRYALEFFAPLCQGRKFRRAHALLVELQDALGALNDLACAGAPLMSRAGADPALREAVALVGGWHGPRYEALRARLPARIGKLLALKPFWKS